MPRFVFAVWLEEGRDPERAEFIRLQCQIARTPHDTRLPDWKHREQELLDTHGYRWAEPLGASVTSWEYRRGFIESVELSLERPAAELVPLLDTAPIRQLRDVSQFCDLSGVVDSLPHLGRLTGLEFWGLYAFDDALIEKMLNSIHLSNLRTLVLYHDRNGNLVPDEIMAAALRSPHRAKIERLAVNVDESWRGMTGEVLRALADSPFLRNLLSLNLSNAGDYGNSPEMDADTARMLGESANLCNLEELILVHTSFDLTTWDVVLRWPFLRQLKRLAMNYSRQVQPPEFLTIAEIADLPAYRAAFDAAVPNIDWETEWFTPWDGNASWRGQSWSGFRQQHLFAIWPYVRAKQYDELERVYRADCLKYAGTAVADECASLDFSTYASELEPAFRQAIAAASNLPAATSIWLRIRTDIAWEGAFHVSSEELLQPFKPSECYSYNGPLAEFPTASLPSAAEVLAANPRANTLDPGGVEHYLIARTVAALGRVVAQVTCRFPVHLDTVSVTFRFS